MTPNPVRWFEIYVQDMPRALLFYETVFGTKLDRLPAGDLEMWAFPQATGAATCKELCVTSSPCGALQLAVARAMRSLWMQRRLSTWIG